jgi:protein-disulfide isomerase
VLAAVLIGASVLGTRGGDPAEPAAPSSSAQAPAYLTGIPQDGTFLGDPDAPYTLIEYADIQCPFCAEYARDVLPALVRRYGESGELRFEYRGLQFLGSDSDKALRAVLAAGEQDKLWNVLHALYARQGEENSGWVADDVIREAGESAPGLDVEQMLADMPKMERGIARASDQARIQSVRGTPTFVLASNDGETVTPIRVGELIEQAFVDAIDAATKP